jgi:hypothetical protein
MNKFLAALLACAWLTVGGCASQPSMPDWVDGAPKKYQAEQYLIGRGQAVTPEEAKDRARADLAKIFEVTVAVDSEDVQSFSQKTEGKAKDKKTAGDYSAQSSRRIVTRTDQIIQGIQIVELWQDPATKAQHALAVLPRLQAGTGLRQEIGRLDAATGKYLEQARVSGDILIKIGAANLALEAQIERAAYQKSLRVVDPTGRGAESEWNTAKLNTDLTDLLKRVRVAPRIASGAPEGMSTVVSGALAAAGFMIETGEKPDYILHAKLPLEDLGLQQGWYWQRGVLEVTLTEVATSRVRGSKRWDIKVSAQQQETARQRALGQVGTILKKELRATISGFSAP